MFKKIAVVIMLAGMMISSFIPAQAFSINGSLDKSKIAIQCYWRENKEFRRIVCGGTRIVIGVFFVYLGMKSFSSACAEVQRKETDYNDVVGVSFENWHNKTYKFGRIPTWYKFYFTLLSGCNAFYFIYTGIGVLKNEHFYH